MRNWLNKNAYLFHQIFIVQKRDHNIHEFFGSNMYMEWLSTFLHGHVCKYQA